MKPGLANVLNFFIVLWSFSPISESLNIKFIKLDCKSSNKSFVTFEKCALKPLARHNVSLNVHLKFYELPIDHINVSKN